MSGTLNANFVQSDLGSDLTLNPSLVGNNNVTIGSGSLNFGTTNQKILGDFTNATVSSRTNFQTSTANSSTGIYALPNGTSTAASWQATNAADPTNASKVLIATNGSTDVQLVSGRNGTGTYLPLTFYTNGSEQARLNTSGQFMFGTTAASGKVTIVAGAGTGLAIDQSATTGNGTALYVKQPATNNYAPLEIDNSSGTAIFQVNYDGSLFLGSNAGIRFNNSSATTNSTLNDYEVGTWSPTIIGSSGTSGQSYNSQVGTYIKIGQQVFCNFDCRLTTKGTISGSVLIGGLPFTSKSSDYYGGGNITYWAGLGISIVSMVLQQGNGTNYVSINAMNTGGTSTNQPDTSAITNSTILMGMFVYNAAF